MAEDSDLVQIINGCKAGKAETFEKLIDIYGKRCYGYFCRLTGSQTTADDLLSELFVKLVGKINSYKGGSFESWLFKIASNVFHDCLRQKQQQAKLAEVRKKQVEREIKGAKKSTDERVDELQIQLEKLDGDTKEVIMLRFYSQLSFKEIARMRAEPIGTTLAKVHRGLKKLRKLME